MKILLSVFLLGSIALAAAASPTPTLVGDADAGQIILIEGTGEPGEGWVEIAPVGNRATAPGDPGIVHLPFSLLGHTKILVNMEHTAWVYAVGQTTTVRSLGKSAVGSSPDSPAMLAPILVSKLEGKDFLEVMLEDGEVVTLNGPYDYLFPQQGFRWMKLPAGSKVGLLAR